jgi:hypothetical protein
MALHVDMIFPENKKYMGFVFSSSGYNKFTIPSVKIEPDT